MFVELQFEYIVYFPKSTVFRSIIRIQFLINIQITLNGLIPNIFLLHKITKKYLKHRFKDLSYIKEKKLKKRQLFGSLSHK